jgi:hypothetical protein
MGTELIYRGWDIEFFPRGGEPWRAEKNGTVIRGRRIDQLKRMIDRRQEEIVVLQLGRV